MTVELTQSVFGITAEGKPADLFTFQHDSGLSYSVTNFGCIITSLMTPDKSGTLEDIVLGYDTLREYENDRRFLGCCVGRYANRIAHGKFTLDGVEYELEKNPVGHHLHGGPQGFHKQLFRASVVTTSSGPLLVLEHRSPHGQGGYPGNVDCKVTYSLSESGDIEVHYYASTDRPTIINLTNHSYFNLRGQQHATKNNILDHQALLNCDTFIPTDNVGIPVSGPVSVDNTPMDFRSPLSFGERINNEDTQLHNGGGYDHNWIINRSSEGLVQAALVSEPVSGRQLEVLTTQPGIQCYTGNNVDELHGKGGVVYGYRGSMCLETQHFPDSPNWPEFPSTVMTPDIDFHETTVFRPGVDEQD